MLVSVENNDKFDNSALAVCVHITLPNIAQNDSKRTADCSATNTSTEGTRSVARVLKEI